MPPPIDDAPSQQAHKGGQLHVQLEQQGRVDTFVGGGQL